MTPDHLFNLATKLKNKSDVTQQAYIGANHTEVITAFAEHNTPNLTPELIVGHFVLKNGCRISPSTGKIINDILQVARLSNAA